MATLFNSFKRDILNGNIDLDSDVIKVMLLSSAFTPAIKTQAKRSDVEAHEVTGIGYVAGGAALANKTVTQDNTNDRGVFDADDVLWDNSTITTARYAVLYKSRGGASDADELIAFEDLGPNKTSNNGRFIVEWNATGIFTLA